MSLAWKKRFSGARRICAAGLCWAGIGHVMFAADGLADRQTQTSRAVDSTSTPNLPANSEQPTLDFVRQHQPKLLKLLKFLEKHQPSVYSQALKEMARSQQRLESLAKRDSELYAVELKLWQVRSELRLLAAELAVASQEQADHSQVRLIELIERESTLEQERLKLLKARAQQEVARLDEQIKLLSGKSDEHVARQLKLWQNRIQKQTRQ